MCSYLTFSYNKVKVTNILTICRPIFLYIDYTYITRVSLLMCIYFYIYDACFIIHMISLATMHEKSIEDCFLG